MKLSFLLVLQAMLPFLSGAIFIVPLNKQHVPVKVKGKTVSHKTAYSGTIYVGLPTPQQFEVVFDTGSGHLFLPSVTCEDAPCLKHRRYDGLLSASGVEINDDGSAVSAESSLERDSIAITYGTGEILGEFVSEFVCLGSPLAAPEAKDAMMALNSSRQNGARQAGLTNLPEHCAEARVILASEMTKDPFSTFAFDGVMGLGLDTLAVNPEFHLLGQMTKQRNLSPIFAVFLALDPDGVSEVAFGGPDEQRSGGLPLQWAPVVSPELGYWRVKVYGLLIDNKPSAICGGEEECYAILDTGTSMLGVPRDGLQGLLSSTARRPVEQRLDQDCRRVPGPDMTFDLGSFSISLSAADYSRPAPSQIQSSGGAPSIICRASMLPVEMPQLGNKVFLFGEPVLKRYYTAYDGGASRVGFARAVQPSKASESSVVV